MSNIYTYYTPTKVIFGRDAEDQVGNLIKAQGCKKVLIHYGGGSVKRSGLLDKVVASLEEIGIAYVTLGGVVPNPRLGLVYEGINLCKKEGVDFLLAVGGGSVIDSAKAIAYGLANEGDVWDFYCGKRVPTACAPVGAILTLAATGSEMSYASVITNEDGWRKCALNNDLARPKFAIMNPELTMTLSDYQTASGCVDIMMHTIERYLNHSDNMELTDSISEALLRTMLKYSVILRDDPQNYEARAEVMWASSLSHNGLTSFGNDGGDWASHRLEHELSGMFDVAHGAGLSAIWASWARYTYKERPDRFAKLAVNALGVVPGATDEETALKGIDTLEEFFHSIHMPISIKELVGFEISDAQLEELADKCSFTANDNLGKVKVLHRSDMLAIYTAAR